MSEDYSFSWYECSGNHRERIWALRNSQIWCSSGHQMREEGPVAPYKVVNDLKKVFREHIPSRVTVIHSTQKFLHM